MEGADWRMEGCRMVKNGAVLIECHALSRLIE